MAHEKSSSTAVLCACAVTVSMLAGGPLRADDTATREELRQLKEENKALQEQLRQQQSLIESLSRKVNQIEQAESQRSRELDRLESEAKEGYTTTKGAGNFSFGKVSLSGEGGAGFFNSGSEGAFPNSEFRVDEARLFVEAPVLENDYWRN
jgi:TolA-binding protein